MLGESELKLLDELLSRSPLAIIAWDKNFRVSYWSARAADMFGFQAVEVMGKAFNEIDLVVPEDIPVVLELQQRLDAADHIRTLVNVNRNRRASGEVRTCRWTTFALQQNDRYYALSYAEDITDALAAQHALADSEERFMSLFANNPETILVFDRDGTIVDVNAAGIDLTRMPREAIVGQNVADFFRHDGWDRHAPFQARTMAGETVRQRTRLRFPAGPPADVLITRIPIFRDGEVIGAYATIRDETEQRATEDALTSLFQHNPDGVLSLDWNGKIIAANDAAMRLGGFPTEETIGAHFSRFLPPQEHERAEDAFTRALAGSAVALNIESFDITGDPIHLGVTLLPQFRGGERVGVYAVLQDITERKEAERRAEMQSRRIRNLYFIAASGDYPDVRMRASLEMGAHACDVTLGAVVEVTNGEARIEAVYREVGTETISDAEIIAMATSVATLPGAAIPVPFRSGIAMRLDVGGETYGALVFADPSGAVHEFQSTDADLLGLIATLIAGTIDRSRQRAKLRAMAYYDALTGLPNRLHLAEKLRDAIEVAQSRLQRVAVLFLDLDRFKDVNDTLGHARGDRLLQMVAERLTAEINSGATIARMGGDEFVVLLTDCKDADHVRDVGERVLAMLSDPFLLDEYEQYISASIGIAVYPEDGRDDQTLIKNADIAMYRAKERGRNGQYFYNPTLEAPIHMRLSQEKLLRRALEYNQFVVYYQPQLDLHTGDIVSVEALVRWNHPKSGLIEPAHFIPSAEMSGLIVPLGDWMLETAAKQVRRWHDTLAPVRLAVNLSGRQFHQRDLRHRVIFALEQAKLDPRFLEVEITESVAMSDAAQTVGIVRDLKNLGIRIAVDDFGTGYSSLAYLRRFALDVLKIDGSFVMGVGHEVFDETIVKTVIAMAHSLGLEVVAEGVETVAQLAFLAEHGCDIVQGYTIAPPLPAAEFEDFLNRRRAASGAMEFHGTT
jgi:diguanylate cyclase (GGDEF)-like protein/PAS domain S-box-containing protein